MSLKFLQPSVTIPASYGLALLNALLERGLNEAELLENTYLDRTTLKNQRGRIALSQYGVMFRNARQLESLDGLAYELGLHSKITEHGLVGYGLMNCASLREALAFNERSFQGSLGWAFIPHVFMDGEQVVISLRENMLLSDELCNFMLDMVMIQLCCFLSGVRGSDAEANDWTCEIWAPYSEPAAYAQYRLRLPRVLFNKPAGQIRCPANRLDQPIASAHSVSMQSSNALCELEMSQVSAENDFSAQVLAHMVCRGGRYPDVDEIAQCLYVSERTLKRRLQDEGSSFQELLDRVRRLDSEAMLANPAFSIKQVAHAVGYTDSSNFARAFFKWTGCSPIEWRRKRGLG